VPGARAQAWLLLLLLWALDTALGFEKQGSTWCEYGRSFCTYTRSPTTTVLLYWQVSFASIGHFCLYRSFLPLVVGLFYHCTTVLRSSGSSGTGRNVWIILIEHIIITAHELSNVIHAHRLHAHIFARQLNASLRWQGKRRTHIHTPHIHIVCTYISKDDTFYL